MTGLFENYHETLSELHGTDLATHNVVQHISYLTIYGALLPFNFLSYLANLVSSRRTYVFFVSGEKTHTLLFLVQEKMYYVPSSVRILQYFWDLGRPAACLGQSQPSRLIPAYMSMWGLTQVIKNDLLGSMYVPYNKMARSFFISFFRNCSSSSILPRPA